MAVLRQELNRTTFQDRQIKLMTDIYTETKNLGKEIGRGLEGLRTSTISGIDKSIQGLYYSFVSYFETGTAAFISDIDDLLGDLREGIDDDSRDRENNRDRRDITHQRQAERYQEYMRNDIGSKISTIATGVTKIFDLFGVSIDQMTQNANTMSELTNMVVRNAGVTRAEAKELRESIFNTVSEMNARTGNFYSPVQSMELITGLINQTSIKNMKFYEEYAEIFLQAQSTMNLNLGSLAEFADRFYRKYNFSSTTMKELVENIRTNTAGTSVSEDTLMTFLKEIDSDIHVAAYRATGGVGGSAQEAMYAQMQGNISSAYTWLHSQGYNSDWYFKILSGALSNDTNSRLALSNMGINYDANYLIDMLANNPAELLSMMVNGMHDTNLVGSYGGWYKKMAEIYHWDPEEAGYASTQGGLTVDSYNAFLASRKSIKDPESQQFMSVEQRTANAAEMVVDDLADLQESMGIKLSTITNLLRVISVSMIGVLGNGMSGGSIWNFLLNKFTGAFGANSGIGNSLSGIGGALGVKGIAGGVAIAGTVIAVVEGIKNAVNTIAGIGKENKDTFGVGSGVDISQPMYMNQYGTDDFGLSNENLNYPAAYDYADSQFNRVVARTGVDTNQDFGTYMLHSLLGPGWWAEDQENSPTLYKIPIIGSAAALIETIAGHNEVYNKNYPTYQQLFSGTAQQRLGKNGATFYKLIYKILSDNGGNPVSFVPFIDSDSQLRTLGSWIQKGRVPTALDSKGGVSKSVTVEEYLTTHGSGYKEWFDAIGTDQLPWYKKGTNYIPNDQIALLHEGEAVVPATENPFSKYSSVDRHSYLKDIADNTEKMTSGDSNSLSVVIEYLKDILVFIKYWKTDSDESDIIKSVLENSRNLGVSAVLSGESSVGIDEAYAGGVG